MWSDSMILSFGWRGYDLGRDLLYPTGGNKMITLGNLTIDEVGEVLF